MNPGMGRAWRSGVSWSRKAELFSVLEEKRDKNI
jgi:hypothetical protein